MLQDRLNKIKDYFQSIEQFEGKWVICVRYKAKWGAYPSDNGKINVAPDETTPDVWWYYGKDNKVDIDSIFDLIEETIQTNIDAAKKVELFKLKANELKALFSNESISLKKLQTLEFTFNENVEPQKTKKTSKSKPRTKKEIVEQAVCEVDNTPISEPKESVEKETTITKDDLKDHSIVTTNDESIDNTTTYNATDLSQEEIDDLRG